LANNSRIATGQLHHSGVLVSDLDRAADFYLDALDGHWLFKPATNSGAAAQAVFGGGPDAAFRFCYIGFDTGAVELIEFLAEPPDWATAGAAGRLLPHFGLVVDDVEAATARVEAAGGSRVWPRPAKWGDATVMYAADPDGNAFELFDVPLESIVAMTIEMFPDSAP